MTSVREQGVALLQALLVNDDRFVAGLAAVSDGTRASHHSADAGGADLKPIYSRIHSRLRPV